LEEKRAQVVRLVERGVGVEDVAAAFGVGRSTVYGWWSAYQERGEKSFVVGKAKGAVPKLSPRQVAGLRRTIVGKDPRQLRFEFALWTRDMVGELIKERYGVTMSKSAVGRLLKRMGLSPQRPLVRAYEQDPEAVRRWKEEEYPKIAAKAKKAGATIFFCDEAGVRTDHHSGTTWAERGKTPVVRGTGRRSSLNMISAVSAKGKLHFCFAGRVNAGSFIEYLKKLLHDVRGKIYLIVDGHSAHTAGKTKQFVASTKGRLELFYLPPYSPELNPDEWVWKNIKHDRVGRAAARSVDDMKVVIEKAVARLQSSKDIVRAFFRSPDLSYIVG
jgi:transposase